MAHFWHRKKIQESGLGQKYANILIFPYGHFGFKTIEVLVAFALLVIKVSGHGLDGVERLLQDAKDLEEFMRLALAYGAIR